MEGLPEPASDPAVAAEGTRAVDGILRSTEAEIGRIAAEAREEVRRMSEDTDVAVMRGAAERRQQLARVRADLLDRATLLAAGFEEILDLLESADAALAAGAVPPVPRAAPAAAREAGVRMVVRERRRVTVAHDVQSATDQAPPPPQIARRTRRWWQVWQRRAA